MNHSNLNIHWGPTLEVPEEEKSFNRIGDNGGRVLELGRHGRHPEVVHQLEDRV